MSDNAYTVRIIGIPEQQYGEPDEIRKSWPDAVMKAKMSAPGVFEVDALDGINALFKVGQDEAVLWWRNRCVVGSGRVLVFSWLVCEIVDVSRSKWKRVPSIS